MVGLSVLSVRYFGWKGDARARKAPSLNTPLIFMGQFFVGKARTEKFDLDDMMK